MFPELPFGCAEIRTQYNLFGQVTKGQDVVDKIAVGDKIEQIEIKDL